MEYTAVTADVVTPARVALVGMMGVGKTTTGSALAAHLGWVLCDSDEQIEARTGASGAVLAARNGVAALHDLEARVFLEAADTNEPTVVCAAASVVDSPRCLAVLPRFTLVVWLEAPVDVLAERSRVGSHRRPLSTAATLDALDERKRYFAELADLRLDATAPTGQLVEQIVAELARRDGTAVTGPS